MKADVLPALSNVAMRGDHAINATALKAVEALVEDEDIAEKVIEEREVVDLLLREKEAVRVWQRILEYERVRARLKRVGVCARAAEEGDPDVRAVLVEGGGC